MNNININKLKLSTDEINNKIIDEHIVDDINFASIQVDANRENLLNENDISDDNNNDVCKLSEIIINCHILTDSSLLSYICGLVTLA